MKFDKWGYVFEGRPEPQEEFGPLEKIQIELSEIFIRLFCKKLKQTNYKRSTYGFKHDVERWSGRYISSGAFAQACVNMGFKPKIENKNHLNFNIALTITSYEAFMLNFPLNVAGEGVPNEYRMIRSGYWEQDRSLGENPWKSENPKFYEDLFRRAG